MLRIENVEVYGWEAAIRGMRNPKNSWANSDSELTVMNPDDAEHGYPPITEFIVGKNDLKLMRALARAGSDHGKFLRFINVTLDITAPLYWWKEFDTYKVGTVANSCSTMHEIAAKKFTFDDFSHEHLWSTPELHLRQTVDILNSLRDAFHVPGGGEAYKKDLWWQMIQLLPSSYNQKRTVQLNYEVLRRIYFARKDHKLDEWHTLCDRIETLPHFKEICLEGTETT